MSSQYVFLNLVFWTESFCLTKVMSDTTAQRPVALVTAIRCNMYITCKKRQNKRCKFELYGDTDLREPLDILRQRPNAAPVVVVEELDDGRVHRVVWRDGAEEVRVLFLVSQDWGGCSKGELGRGKGRGRDDETQKNTKLVRKSGSVCVFFFFWGVFADWIVLSQPLACRLKVRQLFRGNTRPWKCPVYQPGPIRPPTVQTRPEIKGTGHPQRSSIHNTTALKE